MSAPRPEDQSSGPAWAFTLYSEESPEFWIYDNHRKNLEDNQEFTITVKRRSEPFADEDYVRITLLEWKEENGVEQFVRTRQSKLAGTKIERWNGRRTVTFNDLAMVSAGLFRLKVEVMRYRGGGRRDYVLDTLISNDIDFPEIVVVEEI